MSVYEMAKHYYQDFKPPLWDEKRLGALVRAGKLMKDDFKRITGKEYDTMEV